MQKAHLCSKSNFMILLDGKKLEKEIVKELKTEVADLVKKKGRPPHLGAVIVGDNSASKIYVRNKMRLCEKVGIQSSLIELEATITQRDLLKKIDDLNQDATLDGFIVQLPLPDHIDDESVNLAIHPSKDVDGFHPMNIGRMTLNMPSYLPATPQGIITFLERYQVPTEGKQAVVIGRSHIVGRPMSILLSSNHPQGNATVTNIHSRTNNKESLIENADIIVSAVGQPNLITGELVKDGAVVIDVGINRIPDAQKKKGYRLVGDVDFDSVASRCSFITPVPGGVGRMTVVSLLRNTVKAAKNEVYPVS